MLVSTESNITEIDLEKAKLSRFALANHRCRRDQDIEGGGVGGLLIYVYEHVPFAEGANQTTDRKGALGYCATRLCRNYTYEKCLLLAGAYRPPGSNHSD